MRARAVAAAGAFVAAALFLATPASAAPVAIGAYVPSFARDGRVDPAALDAYTERVGQAPVIVSTYKQWNQTPFVRRELDAVRARGAITLLTWEPFDYEGGQYPLAAIAAGRYDGYVVSSARAAAAWGRPVLLRFAHEMNGSWYPWGVQVEGNSPAIYKRAWRRIVGIFREQGAENVEWVWAPQVNRDGLNPFTGLFPGDEWVDWVGLDGYNAGTHGNWRSFTEVFGESYETLTELSSRPVLITETGTSESGGGKPAWVESALTREIPAFERVRGVVWFNDVFNGLDFRIASSPASLDAFRTAVAQTPYTEATPANLLHGAPRTAGAAPAPDEPAGEFGRPSLAYRLTHKLDGVEAWLIGIAALGLLAGGPLVALTWRRRAHRPRAIGPRRAAG